MHLAATRWNQLKLTTMGLDQTIAFPVQIIDWLSAGVQDQMEGETIFAELCMRLVDFGIPLSRATLHLRVHHPQWLGTRMTWVPDQSGLSVQTVSYDVEATDVFLRSPFHSVIASGKPVRQKLQIMGPHRFAVFEELKQAGHSDYVACPLDHTQKRRHLLTFTTSRVGGFSPRELAIFHALLPWYSLVTEIRVKDQLARTLLETYVGVHPSKEILHGATTRGTGSTINAAILISDMRNFTHMSCRLPRDELIGILNEFFDAVAEPIEKHGGEILKFVGDGLLAVFPMDRANACQRLISAVREGYGAASRLTSTPDRIRFGTAIHVGEVMYGNIGSKKRLDFTVIGSAVNQAFRLEALTKTLGHSVLLSGDFVKAAGCRNQTDFLGFHTIDGIANAVEVHALRFEAAQNPALPPLAQQ